MAAASAILKHLPASPLIDSTSVAGGGFINIRLRPAFINEGIARIIRVCYVKTHVVLGVAYSSASVGYR